MQVATDRKIPPQVREVGKIELKPVNKIELDNALALYPIRAGVQPVVKLELVFPLHIPDGKSLSTIYSTNKMLHEGTKHYSARQLADKLEYYGAYIETEQNPDYVSVSLLSLNKHLDKTLPILLELLLEANFPEKELEVFRKIKIQKLVVENEKVKNIARNKFNEAVFGGTHPYGHTFTVEEYEKLSREDLVKHHTDFYSTSETKVIASGNVDDNAIKLINHWVGSITLKPTTKYSSIIPAINPASEKKYFVERKKAVQTAIRIGKPTIKRDHKDYASFYFLNLLLGGYFGSRLMSNIREEKGLTYGIGSMISSHLHAGMFAIVTEARAEAAAMVVDEVIKEIRKLRTSTVSDEEISVVKNYLLGQLLKSLDGAFSLAERWKMFLLYGLDEKYLEDFFIKVKTITAKEILETAVKYLDPDSFYEVVAGKK